MSGERLVFGLFELDVASGDLRRAGLRLRLPPQPAKLLRALLDHPGEVVSREELRRVLWGDATFVDFDHGLNFCVNQLRRVLGDTASNPRFVETVPRAGYRFLAQVTRVPAAPPPTALPRRSVLRGARWMTPLLAAWLITQAGGGSLAARAPAPEPRASVREAYLRGLDHSRGPASRWTEAAQWLERAVVEDPGFGPAQSELASVYLRLAEGRMRPTRDVLPLARKAARAALEADGLDARAHLWAGMAALHGDWDWGTAGREIRQAIALDPRLAEARREHAVFRSVQGDDAGALLEIEEARRLDPLCPVVTGEAAWYRYRAGRPDEAAALWRTAAALRTDVGLHESLLLLYRLQGRPESAGEEALRAMRAAGVPERSVAAVSRLAPPEAVRAYLRGAIRVLDGQGEAAPPERLALLYAALGEEDAALGHLRRACGDRSFGLPRALRDPVFDRFRAGPRFREITARVGAPS
jgi:DNA-binding winged helix-turn-helix (wHTH) protein/tetratricopeptide (TPR) repeat protein